MQHLVQYSCGRTLHDSLVQCFFCHSLPEGFCAGKGCFTAFLQEYSCSTGGWQTVASAKEAPTTSPIVSVSPSPQIQRKYAAFAMPEANLSTSLL